MITVQCAGCQKKLQVRAEMAGKTGKCPGCGKPIRIPAPAPVPAPAPDEDDWIEVNEPADPAEVLAAQSDAACRESSSGQAGHPTRSTASAPAAGAWGEELMEGHTVPEEIKEQIRTTLTRNERLVWFDRPRLDILLHQARLYRLIGVPVSALVVVGCSALAVFIAGQGSIAGAVVCVILALAFGAVGFFCFRAPGSVERNADRRACYMITNRRLLIHPGTGTQVYFRGGNAAMATDVGQFGVASYSGLELTRMTREEWTKKFEGAGDLSFSRNILEEPGGGGMRALDRVRDVEKTIREKLLHPIIDKLLRGERLSGEEKGKGKAAAQGEGDVIAPDSNIKEYGGPPANDPNIKNAPKRRAASARYDPNSIDEELRQQVEDELTAGETILWVGEPETKSKGRGLLGAMIGSAHRVEPDYTLYAITNRRAILWVKKKGPFSYYTPAFRDAGVEDDNRIENGGNIVFRKVKVTIKKTDKKGNTTTRVEMHYFGVLRISNYKAVAALLYDTLIGPCRSEV
jgi:hypothetical protein